MQAYGTPQCLLLLQPLSTLWPQQYTTEAAQHTGGQQASLQECLLLLQLNSPVWPKQPCRMDARNKTMRPLPSLLTVL